MSADPPTGPVPGPPRPVPPAPAPAGEDPALEQAVARLEATPPEDLDGVLAAGQEAHRALQERLGQTGP